MHRSIEEQQESDAYVSNNSYPMDISTDLWRTKDKRRSQNEEAEKLGGKIKIRDAYNAVWLYSINIMKSLFLFSLEHIILQMREA